MDFGCMGLGAQVFSMCGFRGSGALEVIEGLGVDGPRDERCSGLRACGGWSGNNVEVQTGARNPFRTQYPTKP